VQLEYHPLANLFPLIEGAEFDDLVADIRANGLHDTIDLYQGKILDGRNRYRAAEAASIEIEKRNIRYFMPELYGDPVAYVLSKNLKRRHLDESQRAMIAAKIANMGQGRPDDNPANLPVKQADAASRLSISERALRHARRVQDHGEPELVRAVERGRLAVSVAEKASHLSAEIQRLIAAEADGGNANVARNVVKREMRAGREADLGRAQQALPNARFGVIVADPEWRFEPWSRETGMDRAADNHYPTSCSEVIAARDVPSIADKHCILFLWATTPMLPHALLVMGAWGFDYKSHYAWGKDKAGTGYWNREKHELLLIGTRGDIPCPAPGEQRDSLLIAPRGEHSAKPECFLEMIEQYFPTLPKIELNRRGPARKGWAAWGNEAQPGEYDSATGEVIEHDVAASLPVTSSEPASVVPPRDAGSPICVGQPGDAMP
jgi:N6-adenosine-specific RNA methylase IME4